MQQQPNQPNERQRHDRTERRQLNAAGCATERKHNKRNLKSFQEHAFERQRKAIPIHAHASDGASRARLGDLLLECGVFVVQRLVAAGAQDGLTQPLQAKSEQQQTDNHAQDFDRNDGQRRSERRDDQREREQRGADADQRRAPTARHADGQHDRERLDHLDRRGQKGREYQEHSAHASPSNAGCLMIARKRTVGESNGATCLIRLNHIR